jgi:pyrimidine operon attenuation protein/uracil phosphoribosyltransferase
MSAPQQTTQLMSASEMERTLVRLAHEIIERSGDLNRLALIGILSRGAPLARRLAAKIKETADVDVPVGDLDIRLYRDDLDTIGSEPVSDGTDIPFSVNALDIILVDDVLYTGRTVRAALNALFDHGRPAHVQLLSFVERGHRELPVDASYIGRSVTTTKDQVVEVLVKEIDGEEKVLLAEKKQD